MSFERKRIWTTRKSKGYELPERVKDIFNYTQNHNDWVFSVITSYSIHYTKLYDLKTALKKIGVGVDAVQISPYKTAANTFINDTITPEEKEQLDWLLDDLYDQITSAMADGRNLPQTTIQELMNQVPLSAEDTLAAGLVDDLAYQDELAYLV